MKERGLASDQAYSFSSETLVYLLDTYSRWAPIKENDHFLLKVNDGYIEIETNREHIIYKSPSKQPEDYLDLFNFDWIELPRKLLTCLWYAYQTWDRKNTFKTPLYQHRFYLSIIENEYTIDCRPHLDLSKGWMNAETHSGVDATLSFTFNPICILRDEFYLTRL